MLLCNLQTVIKWNVLFGILSILTLGDATDNSTEESKTSTGPNIVTSASLTSNITKPTSPPVQTPENVLTSQTTSKTQMKSETSVLRVTSTTNETEKISTTIPVPQTTQVPLSNTTHGSSANTVAQTTSRLATTYITITISPATSKVVEATSHAAAAPSHIECRSLEKLESNLEVVCFQYPEEINCDTVEKEALKTFLCQNLNITQCNLTFYFSKVNAKCILWVPTSNAGKMLKNNENIIYAKLPIQLKWGYVSEYVTPWRKVTIALVTCGVLLAAFILAGYFLSNRESWSPGRQRLGEDPYYTETDSQGNTLVSVSAHGQDKSNSGTRENGTGQAATPASTNGHSTKKQMVSDTEL